MMNENTAREHEGAFNYYYIIVAIIVSLLNSFYYDNFSVMVGLVIVEVIILIKCLLTKQKIRYLSYFIIFLSTSMESSTFVGVDVFYGFKNFKIVGVNLGAIFIVLMLISLILDGSLSKFFRINGFVRKFVRGALLLTFIAIFMGLFGLLINDNNITSYIIGIGMFINASYIFIFVAIELIVITTIIEQNNKNTIEIKQTLIAIILSLALTLITSLVFQNYGNRGGLPSLQVSNLVMLVICVVLIPFYKGYSIKEKTIITISGIAIFVLGLIYNTNGKMIIIAMIVPIVIILMLFKGRRYKTVLFALFLSFFGLLLAMNLLVPILNTRSPLFAIKYEQASSMVSFWEEDWYEKIPDSPKIRISQFLNITYEYYKKPWFLLTGKGYMGSIKDHLQIFGDINEFSYSLWELNHGLYYVLHETLNTLYLTNGLIGLIFFFKTFKIIVLHFTKSPWIMVGGFWFILFYAYSLTISIFGLTAFIIGLYDLDREK